MHQAEKALVLFLIGAVLYAAIELLWRGHTHWTMAVLGGTLFLLLGGLNNWIPWEMPLLWQIVTGTGIVTATEFAAGCVLNLWLKLDIWDYSRAARKYPRPDLPAIYFGLGGIILGCHCVG